MKINLNRPICFFDLETTGAKVGKDRIVEIAILRVDIDKTESQKVWRINPEMEISTQATQVHGITNEMIKSEPNFAYYSDEIYQFIKDCDLSGRARSNSLKPEEISDGTYTVTNVGNFGSIMGTPIINQPQVGILAIGVIRKLPSVIETDKGDFIGIRKKLILSHTYDHRIINGSVGGSFVKRVAEYLEEWDMNQTI